MISLLTREALSNARCLPCDSMKKIVKRWISDETVEAMTLHHIMNPTTRVCNMSWYVFSHHVDYNKRFTQAYCKIDAIYYHVLSFDKGFYGGLKDHLIKFLSHLRAFLRSCILQWPTISSDDKKYFNEVLDDVMDNIK